MTWTARILFTILTITGLATSTPDEQAPDALPVPAPVLGEVAPLTTAQAELIDSSFERFTAVGLVMPTNVVISFHKAIEACNGNLGLSTFENEAPRIRICWSHETPGIEIRLQEQALVHELAHAWADLNLDDEAKDAFVIQSGSDTWNLAASDWGNRGTERAADLITWALLDPGVLFVEFDELSCDSWAAAFESLTGVSAPSTITDAC